MAALMGKPRTVFTVMPLKNTCGRRQHYHRGLTQTLCSGTTEAQRKDWGCCHLSQAGLHRAQRTLVSQNHPRCPSHAPASTHITCDWAFPPRPGTHTLKTVGKLLTMNTTYTCLIAALSHVYTRMHVYTHTDTHKRMHTQNSLEPGSPSSPLHSLCNGGQSSQP